MRGLSLKILYATVLMAVLYSCSLETYSTKKQSADSEILSYIINNEYNARQDSLGLVYIPIKKGNEVFPDNNDVVAFHYVGYFLNGDVFDSSYDKSRPLIVQLGKGQIIRGLESALLKMDKGAKSKVILPFYLAYDDVENGPVPPFSNLVFELELIDIDKK